MQANHEAGVVIDDASRRGAQRRASRWVLLLVVMWSFLALRIGFAVGRGEPLRDDLALPSLALVVVSALLGSRLYAALQRRSVRR